jgi:uncharacterized protein YjdB
LIGGPLNACVKAQEMAADSTWRYIQEVGFTKVDADETPEAVMVSFLFQQNGRVKQITIPLLTLVPIPYISLDTIDISFTADMTATADGELMAKFAATGEESSAQSKSKYVIQNQMDVSIHASNGAMPAGLAKVLDIFTNSCISVDEYEVIAVTGVAIDKSALTLDEDEDNIGYLTAIITPNEANVKTHTWESSDSSVAKVDKKGNVTALKAGKTIITVTTKDGELTAKCQVTVNAVQKGILETGLKWSLSEGILKISGAGPMPNFVQYNATPWYSLRQNVTAIEVGNEVTAIGNYGFYGMEAATAVTIGSKVEFIGYAAFSNNVKLETIHLPASVKTIGNRVYGTSGSNNYLPYNAFVRCDALISFTVDDNNTVFTAIDGVLYTKGDTQLLICPVTKTSLTIPASVETIAFLAFELCTALTQITVSWTRPPESELNSGSIFGNINVANITLQVPLGASAAYKAHAVWGNFNIVEKVKNKKV